MSVNFDRLAAMLGEMTSAETQTLAKMVITELSDCDLVNLIADHVFGDQTLTDELLTRLENDDA